MDEKMAMHIARRKAAPKRPKKNAERLKVLEEFEFAVATPAACAIADALIETRKLLLASREESKRESDRLNWIITHARPMQQTFGRWLITFEATTDITPGREAIDKAIHAEHANG